MDKKLQDLAWSILPKEFKEEVENQFRDGFNDDRNAIGRLFGIDNLLSDAEGEEMLYCEKGVVLSIFNENRRILNNITEPDDIKEIRKTQNILLYTLFGSKCLPDEVGNEVNFASKEPKPAELNLNKESSTCTNDCPSQCKSQDFDNIVKDGFSKERRLNIATRFAVSLTTVSYREINRYGKEAKEYATDVAKAAFTLADALIKEAEKGGEDVAG